MGHSLGTIKCMRYMSEGALADYISKLILLAPFDKNAFIQARAGDVLEGLLAAAKLKIDEGLGHKVVPVPEFEDYPVTWQTFYSWYQDTELNKVWDFWRGEGYDFPILARVKQPIMVALGSEDQFVDFPQFDVSARSALNLIADKAQKPKTCLFEGCGHSFTGFEDQLAAQVIKFVVD